MDNSAIAGAMANSAGSGALAVLKSMYTKVKSTLVSREAMQLQFTKVRVLSRSFFNPREFSKPENRTEGLRRLQTNILHYKVADTLSFSLSSRLFILHCLFFQAIYVLIFFACLVYTVLSSPMLLVGAALLFGIWLYSFVLISPDTPLKACGFELKRR